MPNSKLAHIALGTGIAIIRIPRFGHDYAQTVVEGTNSDDLAKGPGHYVGTALPGEIGNFAIAGHRVTEGHPFFNLDQVRPGDALVIESGSYWFTYRVLGNKTTGDFADPAVGVPGREIVDPSAGTVIDPSPNRPGAPPSRPIITLTTCNPKYSARQRLVIHGLLVSQPLLKSKGKPAALTQGGS
ncbi:MAG: class E sortase [Mycobacteriales bacterium]